ncbi:MAG TPA: hypothetical protein VMV18_07915 [bacterium]|nr:hypothetical protein [bacterium]
MNVLAALVLLLSPAAVKAADGRAVTAAWTAPAKDAALPAPAVLIVTDGAHKASDWGPVAARLAKSGFGALAIEVRSAKRDPADAAPDAIAALAWLRAQSSVDAKRIVIVGAGAPALTALVTASSDEKIAGLALLSAPLKQGEFDGEQAIGVYGERPVFVGVARGDAEAAKAALVYEGTAHGTRQIYIGQNGGSGAGLLLADAEALDALVAWVRSATAKPAGTPTADMPATTPSAAH